MFALESLPAFLSTVRSRNGLSSDSSPQRRGDFESNTGLVLRLDNKVYAISPVIKSVSKAPLRGLPRVVGVRASGTVGIRERKVIVVMNTMGVMAGLH